MAPRTRIRPEVRAEAAQRLQEGRTGAKQPSSPRVDGRPDPRFALIPSDQVPRTRRKRGEPKLPAAVRRMEDVVMVIGGKKYKQRKGLPPSSIPGVSAFHAFFSRSSASGNQVLSQAVLDYLIPFDDPDYHGPVVNMLAKEEGLSRHHRKRIAQHFSWRDVVIPSLIPVYFETQETSRTSAGATSGAAAVCTCSNVRSQTVLLADWDGITSTRLRICDCRLAAEQLLRRGYFPCAPKRPSVAFSTRLLEFISIHSLNVAPNTTAWGASLQRYWARQGWAVEDKKTFRKRLGTALSWYQVLENRANMTLRQHLLKREETSRKRTIEDEGQEEPAGKRPRLEEEEDAPPREHTPEVPEPSGPSRRSLRTARAATPLASNATRQSSRRVTVEDVADEGDNARGSERTRPMMNDEEELTRPSQELRDRCPICFGGDRIELTLTRSNVIVCLDANFAQKRRVTAAEDGAVLFSGSRFASPNEVDAMEHEVAEKRKAPERPRTRGTSARLSEDVLKDCEGSFVAAQEKMVKASKNYYADTGLMALLCRHDRVLYVANLTSPGERQHYALALLRKLLQGLPKDWCVGILYDIACQLSRSIEKWGFLEEFADRLDFAVSVFHAYGHQWACQLVFHPRKRAGFGMSDGEGCERFWSAIRCLISGLRVSGYHRRLFVLDRQMESLNDDSLWTLGRWFLRRFNNATTRLADAEDILKLGGESETVLEQEWKNQVESQLVTVPRQSSSAADKVIDEILVTMGRIDGLRQELKDERKRLQASHKMGDLEVAETTARVQSLRDEITAAESSLANMRDALGATARAKFESMRGDEYLRTRVNARSLRATIRASLRSYKFERRKIERAFRHQLMQEKDHAQTRKLVHRRERTLNEQVRKFNALVSKIEVLVKQGKGPKRHTRLPRKLEARKLFRLDVDDEIWQEDPGLGAQDDVIPRWQTEDSIKDGIVALLETRRCKEELERLRAEIATLAKWWNEEERKMREFASDTRESAALRAAVRRRLQRHVQLKERWQYDLRLCELGAVIGRPAGDTERGTSSPRPAAAVAEGDAAGPHGAVVEEESSRGPKEDEADDASDDDRSSFYGSVDEEDEDDPVAEMLDELELGDGLASDEEDELVDATVKVDEESAGAVKAEASAPALVTSTQASAVARMPTVQVEAAGKGKAGNGWWIDEQGHTIIPSSSEDDRRREAFERDRKAGKPLPIRAKYWTDRFSCDDTDFARLTKRTVWLSGPGLAVFADIQLKRARSARHALSADIVHSELFWDIANYQDELAANHAEAALANKQCVFRKIEKTLHPNKAEKWLILSHIVRPQHWTLVELRWRSREIRFYDSFAKVGGYATDVEEKARLLLLLCEEYFDLDPQSGKWVWIEEQRPMRQTNGYDCGPFVAADIVSLMTSDEPSTKREKDMGDWRGFMAEEVALVANGMKRWQFGDEGATEMAPPSKPTVVTRIDLTGDD